MKHFLLIFLFAAGSLCAQTEEKGGETGKKEKKGNVFKNAEDLAKMGLAKQKMYAGQYVGALNTYREIEKNDPNNATVLHYIGYCYAKINQRDKAKEYFLKAIATNKDVKP